MTVVDLHNHFFPERWPDWNARFGGDPWPTIRHDGGGKATMMLGEKEFRPIDEPAGTSPSASRTWTATASTWR